MVHYQGHWYEQLGLNSTRIPEKDKECLLEGTTRLWHSTVHPFWSPLAEACARDPNSSKPLLHLEKDLGSNEEKHKLRA